MLCNINNTMIIENSVDDKVTLLSRVNVRTIIVHLGKYLKPVIYQ